MTYLCAITDSMWCRYSTRVKCKSSNITKCFYYSFFFSAFLPFLPPSLHPFFLSFSKSLSSSCKSQVNPQKMVLFSCSAVSNSLRPHGLQHTRPPCPLLSPWVYSNSCSLTWWCHPAISSSVIPFSSCPQSFPASQSFPVSWLFTSGGQSAGASASASILPMNNQGWFPLGRTGLICLSDSQESSPTTQFKSISSLVLSFPYSPTLTSIHDHWKNHSLDLMDLCWQSNVSAFEYAI